MQYWCTFEFDNPALKIFYFWLGNKLHSLFSVVGKTYGIAWNTIQASCPANSVNVACGYSVIGHKWRFTHVSATFKVFCMHTYFYSFSSRFEFQKHIPSPEIWPTLSQMVPLFLQASIYYWNQPGNLLPLPLSPTSKPELCMLSYSERVRRSLTYITRCLLSQRGLHPIHIAPDLPTGGECHWCFIFLPGFAAVGGFHMRTLTVRHKGNERVPSAI